MSLEKRGKAASQAACGKAPDLIAWRYGLCDHLLSNLTQCSAGSYVQQACKRAYDYVGGYMLELDRVSNLLLDREACGNSSSSALISADQL